VAALAQLEPHEGTVVICDCEGAEGELMDPRRVWKAVSVQNTTGVSKQA
jgi:hypothetical protein